MLENKNVISWVKDDSNTVKTIATQYLAPGENQVPMSTYMDKNSEELTFLKIYGGERPIQYLHDTKFSFQAICRSEFRRYDRRVAENMSKLFYSYKKLVAYKLRNSVTMCLKKTKTTQNLTVSDALNNG